VKTGGISNAQINASAAIAYAKLNLAGAIQTSDLLSTFAGDGLKVLSSQLVRDDAKPFTNDNAGSITIRQVVYIKSSNGHVDLALATVATLSLFELGIVQDASIATTASGNIVVREGSIVTGFTGLTPGAAYYVDPTTAGAITATQPSTSGQTIYKVGQALTATTLLFCPRPIIVVG
jgi:hypothetical protein